MLWLYSSPGKIDTFWVPPKIRKCVNLSGNFFVSIFPEKFFCQKSLFWNLENINGRMLFTCFTDRLKSRQKQIWIWKHQNQREMNKWRYRKKSTLPILSKVEHPISHLPSNIYEFSKNLLVGVLINFDTDKVTVNWYKVTVFSS